MPTSLQKQYDLKWDRETLVQVSTCDTRVPTNGHEVLVAKSEMR